jgi:hypothetical protein
MKNNYMYQTNKRIWAPLDPFLNSISTFESFYVKNGSSYIIVLFIFNTTLYSVPWITVFEIQKDPLITTYRTETILSTNGLQP